MINTYFGTFNNMQELQAACKEEKISEYRKLAKRFAVDPSMELSSLMSDTALVLVRSYGLTWSDIEKLDIA